MIDGRTLPDGEPIYTHVLPDGRNIHIHSGRLREWCLRMEDRLPCMFVPIEKLLAKRYVTENIVSKDRVIELMARISKGERMDPAIYVKDGHYTHGRPDVLHVDGHHRYVAGAALGHPEILSWVLEPSQWKPFRIVHIRDFTHQELIDIPVTPRSY